MKLINVVTICLALGFPGSFLVNAVPVIVTQPEPQTVPVGYPAYFAVEATNSLVLPMNYFWFKNGVAIGGATNNFFSATNVTLGDNNAVYTVIVSNSTGVAMSGTNGVLSVLAQIPNVFNLPPFYACSTNYYVATNGSDNNSTLAAQNPSTPWQTISHALSVLQNQGSPQGGVCVNVASGVYTVNNTIYSTVSGSSDTTNGYFVLRSQIPHGAMIQVASNATDYTYGILFENAQYVVIDGFVVAGDHSLANIHGRGIEVAGTSNTVCLGHHFRIYNNIVYGFGSAAIQASQADYIEERNNVCFGCCATDPAQTSGIGYYQPVALDTGTWNTVSASNAVFHIIVGDNVSFNNIECNIGKPHTDGNGIILDTFVANRYINKSLVEGNLCFNNGGSGTAVAISGSYVTIRNNTFFNNHEDDNNSSPWRGEITIASTAASSHDNTVANNIARAVVGKGSNTQGNKAIADVAGNGLENSNNIYLNNLTYNGTAGQASLLTNNTTATITAATGNILGSNPQFISETNFNFTLQSSSPAIDASIAAAGLPVFDLNGQLRPQGAGMDLGAYEYVYSLLITSITLQGSNVVITFSMGPGGTNALQANNGGAFGGLNTNGFTNIFVVTSNAYAGALTNFLDAGAVAHFPSRYYRVLLLP